MVLLDPLKYQAALPTMASYVSVAEITDSSPLEAGT